MKINNNELLCWMLPEKAVFLHFLWLLGDNWHLLILIVSFLLVYKTKNSALAWSFLRSLSPIKRNRCSLQCYRHQWSTVSYQHCWSCGTQCFSTYVEYAYLARDGDVWLNRSDWSPLSKTGKGNVCSWRVDLLGGEAAAVQLCDHSHSPEQSHSGGGKPTPRLFPILPSR